MAVSITSVVCFFSLLCLSDAQKVDVAGANVIGNRRLHINQSPVWSTSGQPAAILWNTPSRGPHGLKLQLPPQKDQYYIQRIVPQSDQYWTFPRPPKGRIVFGAPLSESYRGQVSAIPLSGFPIEPPTGTPQSAPASVALPLQANQPPPIAFPSFPEQHPGNPRDTSGLPLVIPVEAEGIPPEQIPATPKDQSPTSQTAKQQQQQPPNQSQDQQKPRTPKPPKNKKPKPKPKPKQSTQSSAIPAAPQNNQAPIFGRDQTGITTQTPVSQFNPDSHPAALQAIRQALAGQASKGDRRPEKGSAIHQQGQAAKVNQTAPANQPPQRPSNNPVPQVDTPQNVDGANGTEPVSPQPPPQTPASTPIILVLAPSPSQTTSSQNPPPQPSSKGTQNDQSEQSQNVQDAQPDKQQTNLQEKPSKQKRVKFFLVSDLHVDMEYSVHGDPAFYCHINVNNTVYGNNGTLLGQYGYPKCDSPRGLIEAAVMAMRKVDPDPDFILWTGDSDPHLPLNMETTANTIAALNFNTRTIRNMFPSTPLYPAVGNHDYHPTDQMPPERNEMYQLMTELWGRDISEEAVKYKTLGQYGYYVTKSKGQYGYYGTQSKFDTGRITLISLNTVLWFVANNQTANMTDPGNQFAFLELTLDKARVEGGNVIIIGHIPPGSYDKRARSYRPEFNRKLIEILTAYADIIIGTFFGHLHRNVFSLLRPYRNDDVESPYNAWLLVAPAVTPTYGMNPGFNYIEYDAATYKIHSVKQYYASLDDLNSGAADATVWKPGFHWRIPANKKMVDFLVEKRQSFDKSNKKFKQYLKGVFANGHPMNETFASKEHHLCAISLVDFDEFDRCTAIELG